MLLSVHQYRENAAKINLVKNVYGVEMRLRVDAAENRGKVSVRKSESNRENG